MGGLSAGGPLGAGVRCWVQPTAGAGPPAQGGPSALLTRDFLGALVDRSQKILQMSKHTET